MLAAALRDLQWRRRRFLVTVAGTSVLFAMTLVLTGISNGFDREAEDTVSSFGVDTWVVQEDAPGPFLSGSLIPASVVHEVASSPGVEAASAFIFGRQTFGPRASVKDVNVFGVEAAGPAMPEPTQGRAPSRPDEIMVSTTLGPKIGEEMRLAGTRFKVVGNLGSSTAVGGAANVFVSVQCAQSLVLKGAPLVSAIAVVGAPSSAPPGTIVADHDDAVGDLLRPLDQAHASITLISVLLWVVAALIIGSVVYVSALERLRDFAIFKAVGVATSSILIGLAAQATILALAAAVAGSLLSSALGPLFPVLVDIPRSAFLLLPGMAVVVGAIASAAGIRCALSVDPALAFSGP